MRGYWTCQRQHRGEKCGSLNPNRRRYCRECGKARPARKRPAHMTALNLPYEHYMELNGGEFCGICGRGPSGKRRLDRDHCHRSGTARGLLCPSCNRLLHQRVDEQWLFAAAAYLKRSAA